MHILLCPLFVGWIVGELVVGWHWDGCLVGWLFTRQVQEKKDVRTSLCNCGTLRRCVKASSRPRQRHAMPCLDAVVNGVDYANDARALAAMVASKPTGRTMKKQSFTYPQMKTIFDYDGSN
jgi:hypothetical protein